LYFITQPISGYILIYEAHNIVEENRGLQRKGFFGENGKMTVKAENNAVMFKNV